MADELFNKYASDSAPVSGLTPQAPASDGLFQKWAQPDLTPVIDQALDKNPDEVARQKQMSAQTGVTIDAIAQDPQTFEKMFNVQNINKKLAQAPITQQLFSDPTSAAIAQEDVDNLVETENKWKQVVPFRGPLPGATGKYDPTKDPVYDIIRATGAGGFQIVKGTVNTFASAYDLSGGQAATLTPFGAATLAAKAELPLINEIYEMIRGDQANVSPAVSGGFESAGTTLSALLTGNPLPMLGIVSYGNSYQSGVDAGLGAAKAAAFGAVDATIEMATEKLPLKYLTDLVKGASPFWQTLVKSYVAENLTEQIATGLQDANEWLFIHPDKTFGEYLQERPNAALDTLISTSIATLFQTGVVGAVVSAVHDDTQKVKQADKTFDDLNDLQKIYARMRLGQRDPELLIKHQDKVLEKAGVTTVYIDSAGFSEYGWKTDSENGPTALAKQFGIDVQTVDDAIQLGVDIPVTREQFVRHVMMSQDYADIAPHVRFSPSELTKFEAEQYKKSGIQEEVQKALESRAPIEGAGITVYHGTPHNLLEFEREGTAQTGEGTEMMGAGIYVAENRDVAQTYRNVGAPYVITKTPDGFKVYDRASGQLLDQHPTEHALTVAGWTQGNLFESQFKARHDEVIDLDAPLDNELLDRLPSSIKDQVKAKLAEYKANPQFKEKQANINLYNAVRDVTGGNQQATKVFQDLGYVAGKFLDQGSRSRGYGTSNYVVYDPKRLTVVKKNDQEIEKIIDLAEQELGLQGLFTSWREAGMNPKDWETYLRKVEAARNESIKRQKDKVLKEELRKKDAEWKEEFEKTKAEVKETLNGQQVYQAINNIQRDRLDQKQLRYAFHELVERGKATKEDIDAFLELLPEDSKGRKLYTPTGVAGIDPQVWAEQHGYDSAIEMLMDMMTVPDFNTAVLETTNQLMDAKFGSLKDARQALIEARESLHNEDKGDLLTFELNALRGAKKEGRLKPVLIRQAARDTLSNYFIKEVKPDRFLAAEKREGRKAGMALRKGTYDKALKKWSGADRIKAADAKFKQVLSFYMAKEAYKAQRKVEKDVKYLKKFLNRRKKHANLPAESLDAIRSLLEGYRFGPKLTTKKKQNLQEWATKRNAITGGQLTIPARISAEEAQKFYKDITLDHFNELVDTVRNIEHDGKMEGAFQDAFRKQQVDATVAQISDNMLTNIKAKKVDRETRLQREGAISSYIAMVSNADTLLRELDGWEYGVAYNAIKRPYDRAYSEGYLSGSKGFAARDKAISKELTQLFSVYSRSERARMDEKLLIPGVRDTLSHAGVLSVLLNSGNSANLKALVEPSKDSGPQFTMAEIKAIHQYASKKDWEFAQSVWDYLDTFWPEIEAAERRRKGYAPEKVEATPIRTPHGTFRGGYYPLKYDGEVTDLESKADIDKFVEQARFGYFVSSHTRRGHTVERVGSGGRPVKLDLRVLHSHLHQVAYDLEMGDAVNDIYKVLYHPKLATQFSQMGQKHKLDELKLWFGDIVTGELRLNSFGERILRAARTGFTTSKLALNFSNALMQPLGLSNTAAMVGKRNTMWALLQVMGKPHKWNSMTAGAFGGTNVSVWKDIMNKSGFMRMRDDTWHKDINDAIELLSTTWVAKHSPKWVNDFAHASLFYFTKKAQRFADTVTWLAGYRKAKLQNKTEAQAVEFADRMVARSQSSGIFGERTRLERGTFSKNIKQTEMVRAWTALSSYFLAKTNVAIERTKKLKNPILNPGQFTNYLLDMAMIYMLEGVLATWYLWPDDDEGDGLADDIGWYLAGTTLSGVATGLPGIRELNAAAQDYDTGGVIGATAGAAWRAGEQLIQAVKNPQEQIDISLFKNINNLLGIVFHTPSGQINKTAGAVAKGNSGEETEWWEYIFGVKRD